MNYIVFDLQYNSHYRNNIKDTQMQKVCKHEIVEFAAVKLNEQFTIVDTFHSYVKPYVYRFLNPKVQEITKLDFKCIIENGKSFVDFYNKFITWCEDKYQLFSWGDIDRQILLENCNLYGYNLSYIKYYHDLQKYYAKLFDINSNDLISLQMALFSIKFIYTVKHNAMSDVLAITRLFKYIFCHKDFKSISKMVKTEKLLNDYSPRKIFRVISPTISCKSCGKRNFKMIYEYNSKKKEMTLLFKCENCNEYNLALTNIYIDNNNFGFKYTILSKTIVNENVYKSYEDRIKKKVAETRIKINRNISAYSSVNTRDNRVRSRNDSKNIF